MCTLSFSPGSAGYFVAMNRDELLSRGIAESPAVHSYQGEKVIHPLDVSGGSWIAVNSGGTTWALLNWNISARSTKERSRGEVVLEVATLLRPMEADTRISPAVLGGADPFRLVGISAVHKEVAEWRWNGMQLQQISHSWILNHWFSSGRSDELAAEHRGQAFTEAGQEADIGSLDWLRRIHSSHKPDRGAFSVCVHRDDAATVSYTEIQVSPGTVRLSYRAGSPCSPSTPVEVSIARGLKSSSAL